MYAIRSYYADAEQTRETPHPKLRIARSRPVASGFLEALSAWLDQGGPVSDEMVREGLHRWVPEYTPMGSRPELKLLRGGAEHAKLAS